MSDIPTEVTLEILSCLPVESLLRFRCVCKTWKSLIDSKIFVKMQLDHSLQLKDTGGSNAKLILCGEWCWCDLSFDQIDTPSTMITTNYPLKPEESTIIVMGYCNGLLLVTCGLVCALWNPSTRFFIRLPYFEHERPTEGITFFHYHCGFGYDKVTDDYKVLRIIQASGTDQSCSRTVVYSLKSQSYKKIKEFPYWISQVSGGAFVLGALHWLVTLDMENNNDYMIVAFDLGSEDYELVLFPLHLDAPCEVDLGSFDGCLSLSCNYECKHVEIWLTSDRGNTWAKFLSLEVDVNWSFRHNVKPISYSGSGKCVILEKDKEQLLCYDLGLKSMRIIEINNGPPAFTTFLFSGSLLLNSSSVVSKKTYNAEEKQKKSKKRDDFLSTGFSLKL